MFGAVNTLVWRRTVGISVHHLCQRALSVPITKQSMRFWPQDTAAGALVRIPPKSSQPLHPFWYHLCHMWLSVPATNASSLPAPQDDTVGVEVRMPPKLSQPLHPP